MYPPGGCVLEVMGRPVVTGPDGVRVPVRSGQVAAVLALLWDVQRPVRRDEVAELLWGTDRFPDHWAGAVRGVVAKARAVLQRAGLTPGALRADGGMIELTLPDGASTDFGHAGDLVARAEFAAAEGDHETALHLAQQALEIVGGPLAITGEGDWIRHFHDRVTGCAQRARQLIAEELLALDRNTDAIAVCEAAIVADPFDEVAHGLVIRAHLAAGRPAAARRAYDEIVRILATELGVEPSAEVTGLLAATRSETVARPARSPLEGFRGRKDELATLQRCLDNVASSKRPALVLIDGPSGIGKTRLARVFAETSGVAFGWGRCHRHAGVPFEPFVDAMRSRLADDTAGVLPPAARAALERLSLDRPTGHPRGSLGDDRAVVVRDLVAEITDWADGNPLVLVLDDLQWASGDTIALVQRVLEDADAPVLVVATVRGQVTDPLALADLLRAAPATVVSLGGIDVVDLVPLAEELTAAEGSGDDPWDLAQSLHARTGGLAYYVDELTRAFRRGGRPGHDEIPDSVRTWISHRIDALPGAQIGVLEAAAVIGGEDDIALGLVERVTPASVDAAAELDALAREGLLDATGPGGTFRFAHEITREVVTERMGAARRAQLHLDVARSLSEYDDPPHAALARHYEAAGREHFHDAAEHGHFAAAASLTRGAWDLADTQAAGALACCPDRAHLLRAALLCVRGSARHALGHSEEAVADFDEAVALATEHRLPHHLARATLRLVGRAGRGADPDMADAHRAELLRNALEATRSWAIPEGAPEVPGFAADATALAGLQTAVEVELAWATLFDGSFDERRALLTESLERARREQAPPARLARILVAQRNILHAPGDLPERLARTDESLALPAAQIAPETRIAAHLGRCEDLLALGDRDGATAALAAAAELVERHNSRFTTNIGTGPGQCPPAPGAPTLPATYDVPGTYPTLGDTTPSGDPYGLGLVISASSFNQLLGSMTECGSINSEVTDFSGLPLTSTVLSLLVPEFSRLPANTPMKVVVTPTYAPFLTTDPGPNGEAAQLMLANLKLDFQTVGEDGADGISALELSVDAPLGFDLSYDEAAGALKPTITPPAAQDVVARVVTNQIKADPTKVTAVFKSLFPTFVAPLADTFQAFPLPGFMGLDLSVADIERQGNSFVLYANLDAQPQTRLANVQITDRSTTDNVVGSTFDVHEWRHIIRKKVTSTSVGVDFKGMIGADACCTVEDESISANGAYTVAMDVLPENGDTWHLDLNQFIKGAHTLIDEKVALEDAGGTTQFVTGLRGRVSTDNGGVGRASTSTRR